MDFGRAAGRLLGRPLRRLHPVEADAVLAVLLAALGSAELARAVPPGSALTPADPLGHALVAGVCATVALRRLATRRALAACLLLIAVLSALGYRQSSIGLPLFVLVYSLGARYPARPATPVLLLVPVVMGVSIATSREPVPFSDLASVSVSLVGAWWVGATVRRRRDDQTRQAVAEERLRIARELHDVVAHSMSVVAVQSGVAMHVLDADREAARASLAVIASTSRRALDEMRRLLDVLRPDRPAAGELAPAPGLRDLPALAEEFRSAGLAVRLDVRHDAGSRSGAADGARPELPPAVDLTAYRIVQEALTNTLRHAGTGSAADVRIAYGPETVRIDVTDDGRGTGLLRAGAGAGLVGMRERVALFGGTIEVGPRSGGGWSVSARLPLREEQP